MIFGFNTDVAVDDTVYHVQTEDRGVRNPVIESVVYMGGKIVGRRRTSYDPAQFSRPQIEEAVREQHRGLIEAIRTGSWLPPTGSERSAASISSGYRVGLLNAKSLLDGDQLRFQLAVLDNVRGEPAGDVSLDVCWVVDGSVSHRESLKADAMGRAELRFPPPSDRAYAALMICVQGPQGRELAKFHVTAAPA